MTFKTKFVCLSLPDYYKAANDFEALVISTNQYTIVHHYSFTEVPKAWSTIHIHHREVFINPITWERTILT